MTSVDPRPDRLARSAVHRFATWSLLVMLLLVAASVFVSQAIAEDAALDNATVHGRTIADTVASPLVDERVRRVDPAAMRRLGRAMQALLSDGSPVHVKLWSAEGTVLWSDEAELVGRTYPLAREVSRLFGTNVTHAELSDLTKAENVEERADGQLLEVYAGTFDRDENPMVFEAYFRTDEMRRDERSLLLLILPVSLGGLLLFQLAVFPLALTLVRRVKKGELERSRILRNALQMRDRESRRIVREIHDGVIQDLAGLSYVMPTVAAHLPDTPAAAEARETMARVKGILQRDVESLRSLMVTIYRPDLNGPGFASAVQDLAQQAREHGLVVEVSLPRPYRGSPTANDVAHRVIQEGLRNAVKHARATTVQVDVERRDDMLHVTVRDDGVGICRENTGKGHFGLRLLKDLVVDFRGELTVLPRPGGGTELHAALPASDEASE